MKSILILILLFPLLTWAQTDTLHIRKVPPSVTDREYGKVYTVVEQMPSFPGGDGELLKYIQQNTIYPKACKDSHITGTVYVQFVVDSVGQVEQVKVLRSVHPLLDAEATRLVSNMPKWKPGKQNGKEVNVWYTIPVRFDNTIPAKVKKR